jgi:DNA repair protein RadA/Sms
LPEKRAELTAAMKQKNVFRCKVCEHQEPKWLGRCPECGSWNSLEETSPPRDRPSPGRAALSVPLASVAGDPGLRLDAGIAEINRVLGGGIMKGATVLVAGEPGIGKSTLMLQLSAAARTEGRILYISGEESPSQIRLRADRLGIQSDRIELFAGTELSAVLAVCEKLNPRLIIVDSVQTLYSADIGSIPGTVNQLKLTSQELSGYAKVHGAALFLVGHVTKEGSIAGPKVIEHLVDTVLYFDTGSSEIRLLRAYKNRFGSVDEIGLFRMTEKGLEQLTDPATYFLSKKSGETRPAGVAVAPVYEGTRVLLVEIQSLVVPAKGGISRVFSDRIDGGRVARMAAVLEKHCQVRFSDQDIYVNVGGGIRLNEVGLELPLGMALYSARMGLVLPAFTAVTGEVSLAGEIHPVGHLERRIRSVLDMGFRRLLHPPGRVGADLPAGFSSPVTSIGEAVRSCFNPEKQ